MIALFSFTTLAVATLLALAAGTAFQWFFLRVTCLLLQPATAKRLPRPAAVGLIRGTAELVRILRVASLSERQSRQSRGA
jgi:hypothetical protein